MSLAFVLCLLLASSAFGFSFYAQTNNGKSPSTLLPSGVRSPQYFMNSGQQTDNYWQWFREYCFQEYLKACGQAGFSNNINGNREQPIQSLSGIQQPGFQPSLQFPGANQNQLMTFQNFQSFPNSQVNTLGQTYGTLNPGNGVQSYPGTTGTGSQVNTPDQSYGTVIPGNVHQNNYVSTYSGTTGTGLQINSQGQSNTNQMQVKPNGQQYHFSTQPETTGTGSQVNTLGQTFGTMNIGNQEQQSYYHTYPSTTGTGLQINSQGQSNTNPMQVKPNGQQSVYNVMCGPTSNSFICGNGYPTQTSPNQQGETETPKVITVPNNSNGETPCRIDCNQQGFNVQSGPVQPTFTETGNGNVYPLPHPETTNVETQNCLSPCTVNSPSQTFGSRSKRMVKASAPDNKASLKKNDTTPKKTAADKSAADKSAADKTVPDKTVADKSAADKTVADKSATVKNQ